VTRSGEQVADPDLTVPPVVAILVDEGDGKHAVGAGALDMQQGKVVILQQRSLDTQRVELTFTTVDAGSQR
jgi:hypothetical protein